MNNYKRYILTYPIEGQIVHRSDSTKRAVKKCYKEYKKLAGITDGLFAVTDIDSQTEYTFKIKNHKIYNTKKQIGGYNNIENHIEEIENIDNILNDGNNNTKLSLKNIENSITQLDNKVDRHIQLRHENLNTNNINKKIVSDDTPLGRFMETESEDRNNVQFNKNVCSNALNKLDTIKAISNYNKQTDSSECNIL